MAQAKSGDTVKVHYKGTLDDGTVFDSSEGREPLEFRVGSGQVIPGFDTAVIGLNPGDTIVKKIPAAEAYGPHREEMVLTLERDRLPEDLELEVGQELQLSGDGGQSFEVIVAELNESTVTLDGNHPLAGEDLTFAISLESIA
jgi:peptidylprolyl isomerase